MLLGRHLDQLPEWALENAIQAGHATPSLEAHLQEQWVNLKEEQGLCGMMASVLYRDSIALDSVASALFLGDTRKVAFASFNAIVCGLGGLFVLRF